MLVIEIEDCREKGGWRAVDSRNAARGSELEAGDDGGGGAPPHALSTSLSNLNLYHTQQSWLPNS
jgi:hypothetical protein